MRISSTTLNVLATSGDLQAQAAILASRKLAIQKKSHILAYNLKEDRVKLVLV